MLEPSKFIEENGPGWVLMDDKIPLAQSKLKTLHGVEQLPDARGMFIRALNLTRDDASMDAWQKEHGGQARKMGEPQLDDFKSHNHGLGAFYTTNGYETAAGTEVECVWYIKMEIQLVLLEEMRRAQKILYYTYM